MEFIFFIFKATWHITYINVYVTKALLYHKSLDDYHSQGTGIHLSYETLRKKEKKRKKKSKSYRLGVA